MLREWIWHHALSSFVLTLLLSTSARAQYFIINEPSESTQWANGLPFLVKWTQSVYKTFDINIVNLHHGGIEFVAQNVPSSYKKLNVLLQDVPTGDDYFLVCFDSTHGVIYAVSSRFTITNSSSARNPSPDPSVPTVTVSGAPDPLKQFAATLGPAPNAAVGLSANTGVLGFGGILALCAAFFGGAMTLW